MGEYQGVPFATVVTACFGIYRPRVLPIVEILWDTSSVECLIEPVGLALEATWKAWT